MTKCKFFGKILLCFVCDLKHGQTLKLNIKCNNPRHGYFFDFAQRVGVAEIQSNRKFNYHLVAGRSNKFDFILKEISALKSLLNVQKIILLNLLGKLFPL